MISRQYDRSNRGWIFLPPALLFLMALILSACGRQIEVPITDETPPEVWMEVFGLGENIILLPGGEPIVRTISDISQTVTIMTTVVDEDGGVLRAGHQFQDVCGDTTEGSGSGVVSWRIPDFESDGLAPTTDFIDINFSFRAYPRHCGERTAFTGIEYDAYIFKIWGRGENMAGVLVETATFTLIYNIPDPLTVDAPDIIPEPDNPLPDPDFSVPVMVRIPTLCYFGPGAEFETVSSLAEGIEVLIIGIGEVEGWWIIDNPRFPGVACWVEQEDLDIDPSIDVSPLPEYDVPPLPDLEDDGAGALTAPSNLKAVTTCAGSTYSVKLSWTDNSSSESGFRIYRDGVLIGVVGADVTQFTDNNPTDSSGHNYTVRAYDSSKQSSGAAVSSEGCLF